MSPSTSALRASEWSAEKSDETMGPQAEIGKTSPLFAYATLRCAIARFLEGLPQYPLNFYFLQGSESVPYKKAVSFRAAALLPQDHALMSFYELYSANLPLLLPSAEWMYRLLYMRGQLSVGERWYQAIMPNHEPPFCEFEDGRLGARTSTALPAAVWVGGSEDEGFWGPPEDAESGAAESGAPTPQWGLSAAKAARSAAVQTLRRIVTAPDLATAQSMAEATLGLMEDQKYFLMVAANETDQDSATSMGVVRRAHHGDGSAQPSMSRVKGQPWHPYTPFQMSTRDSNDWTRMRKGGWWLRRGFRFDAMRYWHQFSDFARFPGLQYFVPRTVTRARATEANIPELLCRAQSMDIPSITQAMQSHNQATFAHSAAFWGNAALDLLR
ncbi:FHA domain-containing protein (Fragment) [Durusdinium trenchii]|uniref:FHA domain-containing protein n=1 Tax=Durusdinium trenchii TaxID=1381693 RepID=A0ABP0P843_9DINO